MIKQSGQIFPLMLITISVVLVGTLALIGGSQLYYQTANYSVEAEKATALAEAGVDKAINSLNKTGGSYTGELETSMGDGSYSVTITPIDVGNKIIEATGYIPNKAKARVKRTIKITASRGVGVAFLYGIQVGEGGMELGNNNVVTGSVYSNGSIVSGNSNQITGDVWVAGGPQPTPDQIAPSCEGANCNDFEFGKTVGSEQRLDVAQSFKPQQSGVLNKVALRIKKIGNPPDVVVRILQDSGGKPDKNAVLTTGTLYSSLVTSNYPPSGSWIDVTFNTSPALTQGTTYWLMIDTSSDSNNYWSWESDWAQGYTRGEPKWSPNWSVGNATWNSPTPAADLSFKTYLGGAPTSVRAGNNKMSVGGEAHANTIENLDITKDAYYQTIITSTVAGISHPGSADPPPKVFPISDANIAEWKDLADGVDGTNTTGPISDCVTILGPVKVLGDVVFNSGCRVTIKGYVWITGNLILNSNNILTLDSSYGSSSGVIVVDGKIELNSNNHLNGTGVGTSLLMALSNYDSRTDDVAAILVNSNGNTGVYYASRGIIQPGTGNSFKELTAWKIRLVNSSTIDYETGLSSTLFSSGPGGSFTLVKGTYQVR